MDNDKELREIEELLSRLEGRKQDRLSDHDMETLEEKISTLQAKFSSLSTPLEELDTLERAEEKRLEINELIRDTFEVINKFDKEKKTDDEIDSLTKRLESVREAIKAKYPTLSEAQIAEYKAGDVTIGTLFDRLDDIYPEAEISTRVRNDSHAFDGFMNELKAYKEKIDKIIYDLKEKKFGEELKDALKPTDDHELHLVELTDQDYMGRQTKKVIIMSQKEFDLTQDKGFPFKKPYFRSGGRDYDDSFIEYKIREPESLREIDLLRRETVKRVELREKAQSDPTYDIEGVITIDGHEVAGIKLSELILAGINPENVKFMTMEEKRKKDSQEKVSSSTFAKAAKGLMSSIIKRVGDVLHRREPIKEKAEEQKIDVEKLIEELDKELDKKPLEYWSERVETLTKALETYPQVVDDYPESIDSLSKEQLLKLLDSRRKSINLIDNKRRNIEFLTKDIDSVNDEYHSMDTILEHIAMQFPELSREQVFSYVRKGGKRSISEMLEDVKKAMDAANYDRENVNGVMSKLEMDRTRLEEEKSKIETRIAEIDGKEFEDGFRSTILGKESPLVLVKSVEDNDGWVTTTPRIMTRNEYDFAMKYKTILPKEYAIHSRDHDKTLINKVESKLSGDEQMQLMEAEERRKKVKEEYLANPNARKYTVKGKVNLGRFSVEGREYSGVDITGITRGELIAVGIDPDALGFEEQREEVR